MFSCFVILLKSLCWLQTRKKGLIFVNQTSDKGLVSRKCEELLKLGGKNKVFRTQVEDKDSQRREADGRSAWEKMLNTRQ